MNLIVLIGRLTRDPELKFGQSGKAYCKFSIAVDNPMKKDEADFVNCSAFGKTAELIGEHMRKGSKIGVNGRFSMNRYEKDGEKRTSYEVLVDRIEFLDGKRETTASNDNVAHSAQASSSTPERKAEVEENYEDDEFPF
ncbi:MAG: single-stranded DNA-binding protein [Fusobacteriaceae bacterium]